MYGCEHTLKAVVNRVRPKYHLFGHIHEDYGMSTNGETTFINASCCAKGESGAGKPNVAKNGPVVFDLPRKKN
jgi:Icc-related predicted phosphoesterase